MGKESDMVFIKQKNKDLIEKYYFRHIFETNVCFEIKYSIECTGKTRSWINCVTERQIFLRYIAKFMRAFKDKTANSRSTI